MGKITSWPYEADGNGVVPKFPSWIIAAVVVIVIVVVVVPVYFAKVKKSTREATF